MVSFRLQYQYEDGGWSDTGGKLDDLSVAKHQAEGLSCGPIYNGMVRVISDDGKLIVEYVRGELVKKPSVIDKARKFYEERKRTQQSEVAHRTRVMNEIIELLGDLGPFHWHDFAILTDDGKVVCSFEICGTYIRIEPEGVKCSINQVFNIVAKILSEHL